MSKSISTGENSCPDQSCLQGRAGAGKHPLVSRNYNKTRNKNEVVSMPPIFLEFQRADFVNTNGSQCVKQCSESHRWISLQKDSKL
jgi:hypothetical protein